MESGIEDDIVSIERVTEIGLHNPQTLDGNIVVNGIVATTYTEAILPPIAEALLAPVRASYHFNLWRRPFDNMFSTTNYRLLALLARVGLGTMTPL